MRLTLQAEYAVRTLMFLAMQRNRLSTIGEIADRFQISKNHLMKVAHTLSTNNFIVTVRGRSGGLRLARPPKDINIGEVVQLVEGRSALAEYVGDDRDRANDVMRNLRRALREAIRAFYTVLGGYSLKNLVDGNEELERLMMDGGMS